MSVPFAFTVVVGGATTSRPVEQGGGATASTVGFDTVGSIRLGRGGSVCGTVGRSGGRGYANGPLGLFEDANA